MRYAYVVTMRKDGDAEKHSYIIGVYTNYENALVVGSQEEVDRYGKYKAVIEKFGLNEVPEIVEDI